MTTTTRKAKLNRPQHPSQDSATQTPTSEQQALALSTSAAHSMRQSLNSQIDHVAGLQQAYIDAASPVAESASDFIAGAVSGELLWTEIVNRAQEKLQHLPKAQHVPLTTKDLKPFSWKPSEVTKNQYLPSANCAFLEASQECTA